MRTATLTLGIVQLPTDSVRKVYRVKRNKAKGKVCKSKRAGAGKSPGGGTNKSPAGRTGQKRNRDKAAGSSRPKKRHTVAASEPDDMDEDNDGPHLESLDIFCAFQEQGEHITTRQKRSPAPSILTLW